MTNEDRKAKITELRAEADRLEREIAIFEKAVNGALFRSYGKVVLIPPRIPVGPAIALEGGAPGCECYGWDEDPDLTYIGLARDLLTIKTPDAPEPTGVDLPAVTLEWCDDIWRKYPLRGRESSTADAIKWVIEQDRARLYREDRP